MGCGSCRTCGSSRRLEASGGGDLELLNHQSPSETDSWSHLDPSRNLQQQDQWSWRRPYNTWNDYSSQEESFRAFAHNKAQRSRTAFGSVTPPPPHNYVAVVRDMNYILSSLAEAFNANCTEEMPKCFLGAKIIPS